MKKYFEILELDMSASIEEVEQAYKELSEAWRPESYQNLPRFKRKAEIKLKEVNDAYERVRSYLLLTQTDEAQKAFAVPADRLPEPEAQTRGARETPAPQSGSRPKRKAWMLGLIGIAAAASALLFYLISDRQNQQAQKLQTVASEKEKPAPDTDTASTSAAGDQLKKESGWDTPAGVHVENKAASDETIAQQTHLQKRTVDAGRITLAALSRYNRNPVRIKKIQNGLITIGYNTGPIDGVIGPQTTGALRQFAAEHADAIEAGGLLASDFTAAVLVFAEVAATHPDWNQIIAGEDFAHWLDSQTVMSSGRVKQLKKSATARQVIEMLDLYKSKKSF